MGLEKSAKAEEKERNLVPTTGEEKSSEGKNPRALETEKCFQG
jgi:hypothetical protein